MKVVDPVAHAAEVATEHMEAVRALFMPGVKITLAVRRDGRPEHDFLLTDDDLGEVIAMLRRRQEAYQAAQQATREKGLN